MKKLAIAVTLGAAFILPAQDQSFGQGQEWSYSQSQRSQQRAKQKTARQKVAKQPRQATGKPCVRYHWTGCLGWDPDPHVRAMILHDSNIYDD